MKNKRQAPLRPIETKECWFCGGEMQKQETHCKLCGTKRKDLILQNMIDRFVAFAIIVVIGFLTVILTR